MTKATLTKILGTSLSVLLAGLATYFKGNPLVMALLPSVSAFLLGALHIQRPGDVKLSDVVVPSSAELKP